MKTNTQVVVIGGGVIGASVLYHLTKLGWTDVVLLERTEYTAGSTWHSAGGMHTLNGDPNVAKLQQYTITLYEEIEKESGMDASMHITGGVMLADTPERMDWLKMSHARGRYLGMETELISAEEAQELLPILDPQYFVGAMWDAHEPDHSRLPRVRPQLRRRDTSSLMGSRHHPRRRRRLGSHRLRSPYRRGQGDSAL